MINGKIMFIITLLLLAGSVFAQTMDYCIDNITIMHIREAKMQVNELNITRTFYVQEPENCSYGCQNNQCLNSPSHNWLIAIGIFIGIFLLLLVFYGMIRR